MWLVALVACGSPGELRVYGLGVASVDLRFTDPTYDTAFDAPGFPAEELPAIVADGLVDASAMRARGDYGSVVDAMDDCRGGRSVAGDSHLGHLNVAWPLEGTPLADLPSTCDPETFRAMSVSLLWDGETPTDPAATTAWIQAGNYLEGASVSFEAIEVFDEASGHAVVPFQLSDGFFCDMPDLEGTLAVEWEMTSEPLVRPLGC